MCIQRLLPTAGLRAKCWTVGSIKIYLYVNLFNCPSFLPPKCMYYAKEHCFGARSDGKRSPVSNNIIWDLLFRPLETLSGNTKVL
jgi:hypothetical protein